MKNGHSDKPPKPKRFYADAAAEASEKGWQVMLDGRPIKTPALRAFLIPSRQLAEAIAEEWRKQEAEIDHSSMPLTKLANTALDAGEANADAIAQDILSFASRDLLCYRAEGPESLIERQRLYWDPVLEWAKRHYGVRLAATHGIMPVDQPPDSHDAFRRICEGLDPFSLTAFHVMTSLTGSAVLALAHMEGHLSLETCWSAAHVDEDFQIEHWGEDSEAKARRERRFAEMLAASSFFQLSRPIDMIRP